MRGNVLDDEDFFARLDEAELSARNLFDRGRVFAKPTRLFRETRVVGALARNSLDVSINSPEQLTNTTSAPNLGNIAYDALVPKRPLIVREDPHSPRSEAFRQLRKIQQTRGKYNSAVPGVPEVH